MRIRILCDLPISPVRTFRAGQILIVPSIPPEVLPYVDGTRAEILPDDEPELAIVGTRSERAVLRKGRART